VVVGNNSHLHHFEVVQEDKEDANSDMPLHFYVKDSIIARLVD
jgi:hypothetical protein